MKPRKKVIGDLYLSASILFIFLTFVAVVALKYSLAISFLAIGMLIGLFGVRTKKVMIGRTRRS